MLTGKKGEKNSRMKFLKATMQLAGLSSSNLSFQTPQNLSGLVNTYI